MSKIFSKVLAICALVVTLPLLVVGTSLAAYYSINASMAVEIYTNYTSASANAYAKVNGKAEDFEITKSHLTSATLKADAVGYDFIGWYNGTAESYAEAFAAAGEDVTQIAFVSKEDSVTLQMAEIENVLAVFNIKTYAVSYNYERNPGDLSPIEDVPTGGKTTYNFGEVLPKLTTTIDGYKHNGWDLLDEDGNIVDDAHYKTAEFAERDSYILHAFWDEAHKYTVTYSYGDLINIPDEEETDTYEGREKILKDPTAYAAQLTTPLQAYERLVWVVEGTNTPVTKVSEATTVVLTKMENTYRVTITETDIEDMYYVPVNEITFTHSTLANLENLYATNNWRTKYAFWKFDADSSIKLDGTAFGTAAALANAIYEAHANEDAAVSVTATVKKNFTSLAVATSNFKGVTNADLNLYTKTVYMQVGDDPIEDADLTMSVANTTMTLAQWIHRTNIEYFVKNDNNEYVAVQAYKLGIQVGANYRLMEYAADATINDFINYLYTNGYVTDAQLGEELQLDNLFVIFNV